jgi:hypothetical protein
MNTQDVWVLLEDVINLSGLFFKTNDLSLTMGSLLLIVV